MNNNFKIDFEYKFINNKKFYVYNSSLCSKKIKFSTNYNKIINILNSKLNIIKNNTTVDSKNILLSVKFIKSLNNEIEANHISISIIIPLLDYNKDTIFESMFLSEEEFEIEIDGLFSNINKKLNIKYGDNRIICKKYNYLLFDENSLKILLTLLQQYFTENSLILNNNYLNTNNLINVRVVNCINGMEQNLNFLENGKILKMDNINFIKNVNYVYSKKVINSTNYLKVTNILNYITIISFETGDISLVLDCLDELKNIKYSYKYNSTAKKFIESFCIHNKNKKGIILKINGDCIC